ncbi:7789_t:CDS:2 [Diversispora eburnea]|uniref:7789_t:CDS:1 n=2 Tax=Diversisporales TaxID=214509 RepID=A0A9N8V203_9GLOM|nr:7789_t:CDS:2 [Diversispora eburnea]
MSLEQTHLKSNRYSPSTGIMERANRRKSTSKSSHKATHKASKNTPKSEPPQMSSFDISISSIPSEYPVNTLNIAQKPPLNDQNQPNSSYPSLSHFTMSSYSTEDGNAWNTENTEPQSSENISMKSSSTEDNYPNMLIINSEGSSLGGQSRESSNISNISLNITPYVTPCISRDVSFSRTESGLSIHSSIISQSRSSSPFIHSESHSPYQSSYETVNEDSDYWDDSQPENKEDDDDDSGYEMRPISGIDDNSGDVIEQIEQDQQQTTQNEDQIPEMNESYFHHIWNAIKISINWIIGRLGLGYIIEPFRTSARGSSTEISRFRNFMSEFVNNSIRVMCGNQTPEIINFDLISDNGNIGLEHNDALIKSAVADKVKTLCAAEVQKRIPPQNQEMVNYRANVFPDENVVVMVRQEIQRAVEEMLYTYSQDKLNKADFALSSGGAKILSSLTSPTYEQWPTQWYKIMLASTIGHGITRGKPPVTAIQPDTHVGQCWPFTGQEGQLAILLSREIYVTAVTYDHVSINVAMGLTSAPKEFDVYGIVNSDYLKVKRNEKAFNNEEELFSEQNNKDTKENIFNNDFDDESDSNIILDSSNSNIKGDIDSGDGELKLGSSSKYEVLLGRFVYDVNGPPIQTFDVNKVDKPIIAVILKVRNNWDNPKYTCLYRFRVHGERADLKKD